MDAGVGAADDADRADATRTPSARSTKRSWRPRWRGDRSTWSLPVVAETWDGVLNDVNGFHVRPEHARAALDAATDGPVAEGNVGGGTGMICHGFKGGIGTASRVAGTHTVGVLVQANHGTRARLVVDGVPVGRLIGPDRVPLPPRPGLEGAGSIVVVVATDAPLLPHQCERSRSTGDARRGAHRRRRASGRAETSPSRSPPGSTQRVEPVPQEALNPLFYAAIEATEEAIVNALLAAETMTGRGGATVHALEPSLLARRPWATRAETGVGRACPAR